MSITNIQAEIVRLESELARAKADLDRARAREDYQQKLGAQRCPKCEGRGAYDDGRNGWTTALNTECELCHGTGVVRL